MFILILENKTMKMKNIKNNYVKPIYLLGLVFITVFSCEREISDDAVPASFSNTSEVFLDGFSGGMQFQAFGDIFNFQVDNDVTYKGTASMRFSVPAEGETGSFAGGNFFTGGQNPDGSSFYAGGRDLSDYDALTFWAKSSISAEINEVGFGLNPEQGDQFRVSLKNVKVNSNWKKYYIPIPDGSKLKGEQGLFYYFEDAEEGVGYTFWIDELQFENLGTLLQVESKIFNGSDETTSGFTGVDIPVSGVSALYSLPDGSHQALDLTTSYFDYIPSELNVVSGDNLGSIYVSGAGTTVLTPTLDGKKGQGTLTVESLGDFLFAPTPSQDAAGVISLFSNAYTNVAGYRNNLYWEPWQTTTNADFSVTGDDIINYVDFNFVGNTLTEGVLDASAQSNFHFDLFIPGDVAGAQLNVVLRDFGADGADGGGDDSEIGMTFTSFTAGEWNSFDIPLGSTNRDSLGFIIWDNVGSTLTNFYLDNLYFY
ncbi:glycosyl hydrolase family 16 [Algibacter marinivivus]|uniref:Glycosyl hydrolase family 16 n=2 Tax=Algibacter marinivivus TaxID=2100723 RepID=A0A2U2X826_9FLAO|nr:glycosyl hydrolase family 16 [Algibacter marinivivus]